MKTKFISFLLIFILVLSNTVFAEISLTRDDLVSICADGKDVQSWLDTVLPSTVGEGGAWYAISLLQSGKEYDFSIFSSACEKYLYEKEHIPQSTEYFLKLFLVHEGKQIGTVTPSGSIMNYIFALHLINNGAVGDSETIINHILTLQLDDGGWCLFGKIADTDVTAMVLQSLAPHKEKASEQIAQSLDFLSKSQLSSGGFKREGKENCESSAQVIVALRALGIDIFSDTRFIKENHTALDGMMKFYIEGQGFCHAENSDSSKMTTAQALCALTSLDTSSIFILPSEKDSTKLESDAITDATTDAVIKQPSTKKTSYKIWVCGTLFIVFLLVLTLLFFKKQFNFKNFLFVFTVFILLCIFTVFTSFYSPSEYYNTAKTGTCVGSVTVEILCDAIEKDNILPKTEVALFEGDTVYDILIRVARENSILIDKNGHYITALGGIYEFDYGDTSGWTYEVNGEFFSVGSDSFKPKNGDNIEWIYTLKIGSELS